MGIVTVKPNQTMCDVVIQATGSMLAAMQFCGDNGVSITDVPTVGTVYTVTDAALILGDAGVLRYLAENGIVVGTMGTPAPLPLLNDDGNILMNDDGSILFSDLIEA